MPDVFHVYGKPSIVHGACRLTTIAGATIQCPIKQLSQQLILTHWGRVTHICVSKLSNIGSDNGLSPGRRQAIISTNAGILLIGSLGTNFSEILAKIITFSFKKMYLKVSSAKWRSFCLGLNVLRSGTFRWNSRVHNLRRSCSTQTTGQTLVVNQRSPGWHPLIVLVMDEKFLEKLNGHAVRQKSAWASRFYKLH